MEEGKRLNHFEHALKRPDVYIGSVKTVQTEEWCFEEKTCTIQKKRVRYNPGLVRIFIEILSNSIDNKWRSEKAGIPMKRIAITLDEAAASISVWNDGAEIPTGKRKYSYKDPVTQTVTENEIYPAELYFGYMLAGTNYDDTQERKTSGRNGMGAKAANVFSQRFEVDHASAAGKCRLIFRYETNLTKRHPPESSPYRRKTGYTRVTFVPDYAYFKYPGLDKALRSVYTKLAYDTAMITGLQVSVNGEKIEASTLEKYVALYFPSGSTLKLCSPTGDEAVVVEAEANEEDTLPSIPHVSFVNGVYTQGGGVHVKAWQDAFISNFVRQFNARKGSKLKATARDVYPYLVLFVRCEVTNPAFQSQTKAHLMNPTPLVVKLPKKGFERMLKWKFATRLIEKLQEKADRMQARKETVGKRLLSFGSKADDANWAGTRKSAECTLFITEGQSAKAFATAGISTLPHGHDRYGAFAIKGKFINAKNNSARILHENIEVQALARIVGLERGRDYSTEADFSRLRYGKVCFLTDADDDGIHIRGLLINFFAVVYPSLWKRKKNFFTSMSTPVNMVTYSGRRAPLYFYTTPDFLAWQAQAHGVKPSSVRYIKGLGTMTAQQAKKEFGHPKNIQYVADASSEELEALRLGFDGTASSQRKSWILEEIHRRNKQLLASESLPPPSQYEGVMSLTSFIGNHVIVYHCTAVTRALPSFVDGLKESQRKILYGCFLKNLKKPGKVDQLAGFIAERTGYRHGGVSLQETIVKMAQGFVGSNNLPLLQNSGQFGSRAQGGADAAAARYIYTAPERITRFLYRIEDDAILPRVVEDGVEVEPVFYAPIIPVVLVNGARGIASGFSTLIPAYNPLDLVAWIRKWIKSPAREVRHATKLVPWYRGFTGTVSLCSDGRAWTSAGTLGFEKDNAWHVRELPVGLWTGKFKEYLEGMASTKRKNLVTSISTYNTPNTVHFKFRAAKHFIPSINHAHNLNVLQQKHSLKNMTAIDEKGVPVTFESAEVLLYRFCSFRLPFYEKRRQFLLRRLQREQHIAVNKVQYIRAIIEHQLDMAQETGPLEKSFAALGLVRIEDSYAYLLNIPTSHVMSKARADDLESKATALAQEVTLIQASSPELLWLADLTDFEKAYRTFLKTSVKRDDC